MSELTKKQSILKKINLIKKNLGLYLLLLPSFLLLICFSYIPMYGIVIAFKDYKPSLGIMGSPWSEPWYKYLERFFNSYQFTTIVTNTIVITLYSLLVAFPIAIIFAIGVNQMRSGKFKKVFQTVTYMPHFISTVVVVGLIQLMLSPSSGILGNIYELFGKEAPNVMGTASMFKHVYVWSDIWQHTGWDSIIYIAALASIDPSLYEAAIVDGASRWKRILHIDIPLLMPTAVIMLVLRVGGIMSLGFEKVYLMQNDLNITASEVISTYVYKVGIIDTQYSYSAAIGLFSTVINFVLLVTVNKISKKLSDNSLW